MYQRYYKQRKFGRVFSFVLVVGSGLSHYVKSSLNIVKAQLKVENILKYEEYLPDNFKNVLHSLNEIKSGDRNLKDLKNIFCKEKDIEKEFIQNNKWIFQDLKIMNNKNNSFMDDNLKFRKENFDLFKYDKIDDEVAKLNETYIVYNKIINKF